MMFATITTQFEGYHQYPEHKGILKHLHRHIFHVKIYVEQRHNNRDIEFIEFKQWVNTIIGKKYKEGYLGAKSCEMVAQEIKEDVEKKYPDKKVIISVSEDGENGCLIN